MSYKLVLAETPEGESYAVREKFLTQLLSTHLNGDKKTRIFVAHGETGQELGEQFEGIILRRKSRTLPEIIGPYGSSFLGRSALVNNELIEIYSRETDSQLDNLENLDCLGALQELAYRLGVFVDTTTRDIRKFHRSSCVDFAFPEAKFTAVFLFFLLGKQDFLNAFCTNDNLMKFPEQVVIKLEENNSYMKVCFHGASGCIIEKSISKSSIKRMIKWLQKYYKSLPDEEEMDSLEMSD